MKAETRPLTFLATEGAVKIPFFQRAYVWNEKNWEDLIADLLKTGKSHFLGSLILKQVEIQTGNSKQVLVIDGQQRLTTLTILLRALFNSFDSELQIKCKADGKFDVCLFYKRDMFESEVRVKIEHSKVDKKHYQSVIRNEIDPETIEFKSCESNILKCFKFYTERLKDVSIEDRKRLFSDLLNPNNNILVVIDLTKEDDEQSIFDTINSAGMRLSSADIIKNVLFQKAFDLYSENSVESLYKENWESVFSTDEQSIEFWATERTLGRLKRDNIEILLHCIAVIEGFFDPERHTLADIANIYKEYINALDSNGLKKFIVSVSEYAKLYREKMYNFENSDLFEYVDFEKRLFHVLSVCDVSTFHPYILYVYRTFATDRDELKMRLEKLESLIVRRFVCNSEAKNYNKLCKEFIGDHLKLNAVLAETSDDVFKSSLQRVGNKQAALVLFWVELYRRHINKKYDKEELKYTYTLEHIMPQKWEEYWSRVPVTDERGNKVVNVDDAKVHRYKAIYNIGNMTLLKSSLNTAIRNYDFKRKIEGEGRKRGIKHYADLGITKLDIVAKFDAGNRIWDEQKIFERYNEIANDATVIWHL